MPSTNGLQWPPPENWQDFESLCCDLWRRIWDDPDTLKHGREGQSQRGVDVFGRPGRGSEWAGVQCKLKSELTGGRLTRAEIEKEVAKARDFNPRIASLTIATTAPRDAAVQEAARQITEALRKEGLFSVSVASWEDVRQRLAEYPDLLAKHYPGVVPDEHGAVEAARRHYLSAVWDRLFPLPLVGVAGSASGERDAPLVDVYTALDVTAEVRVGGKGHGGPEGKAIEELSGMGLRGDPEYLTRMRTRVEREAAEERKKSHREEETYGRRWTALEAAAAVPRLVLLGPAGSGKSTFARYLALSLAGETLGRAEANLDRLNRVSDDAKGTDRAMPAWPHGAPLPLFVELLKLVSGEAFPGEGKRGEADHLLAFLEAQAPRPSSPSFGRLLEDALSEAGALLILDGLDETPAAEKVRERLRQIVASFGRRYPRCRMLVTCRPYAYEKESPWRLDDEGFEEAHLAPFDEPKVRAFVQGWYRQLAARGQVDEELAAERSRSLCREIESSSLQPLVERPLMLTMMADLHASSGGRLPGGRAGLYERSVELLLDRWNEKRGVLGNQTVAEHLGMGVRDLRFALEDLAYQVHLSRGSEAASQSAEIEATELWQALDARRKPPSEGRVDERRVMDYLHQRSGILIAESHTVYRFPHRSYQEYLAACHLSRTGFPGLLIRQVIADPALWREVLLLAAGKVAESPFTVWALLDALVPEPPTVETAADDPRFPPALLAALAIAESELWRDVQEQDGSKLERIRQWLERLLELGALSPVDRAAGGRVLAVLGDRRKGVGLRRDGLPDVDWLKVPAGPFTMGPDVGFLSKAERIEIELPAFRIARYPVTNAQYRAFVEAGGYTSEWRRCWTDAGWAWKGEREGPDEDMADVFLLSNHPRVNVTWHEAHAFCGWLSERLGLRIGLPSEAQWEKAARGTDERAYPWGDDFDPMRCNTLETGIRATSAVGAFPGGKSPFGVLDMAGNVWEWCATQWRESYEEPATEDPEGTASRVARGGSFVRDRGYARCAFRCCYSLDGANASLGFRVSAPIL